jgi:hypothetical protein
MSNARPARETSSRPGQSRATVRAIARRTEGTHQPNRSRASGDDRSRSNRSRASGDVLSGSTQHRIDRAAIAELHTFARPAGSTTERHFIRRFIATLPGATQDNFGNWHVVLGAHPTTLWSSHTDTVARRGGRQRVVLTEAGLLRLDPSETYRNCLGADDTAGIWIMREMIAAGIPGRYVFHYAEEIGAIGSSDLAREAPAMLDGITCAVAFDRAGTDDVITHQFGDRCASEAFAVSLADALHAANPALTYAPARGVFTDTASYMDLVPECTNLSVGYENAHSAAESLDTTHLIALRDAMLRVDASTWTVMRNPLAQESEWAVDLADLHWEWTDRHETPSNPFDTDTDRLYWNRLLARYH